MYKVFPLITKAKTVLLIVALVISTQSCKKSYLDVIEPTAISPEVFPAKVEDLDLMLNDLYGRLRSGYFHSDQFAAAAITLDHVAEQTGPGATYGDMIQNRLLPTHPLVSVLWTKQYEGVSRTNAFLEALARFRTKGGAVTPAIETRLKLMEGQALFIRAFFYFYLVNFFSEVPLTTDADRAKLAVPLWDKVPESVDETNKERATIGQVWDFITSDLEKAEGLLAGKTVWDAPNRARVDIWSVKGFLAKAYLFNLKYDKARDKAKEIIDQSSKTLVPFAVYRDMFLGMNEFNAESLFEINYINDRADLGTDIFTNVVNTSNQYLLVISAFFLAPAPTPNGFANLTLHDANIPRFGFNLNAFTVAEQSNPAYIAQSIVLRNTKQVDPRLTVSTLQPYVDSLKLNGVYFKVAKAQGTFDFTNNRAWSQRKYNLVNKYWLEDFAYAGGENMYFMRMADLYLIYAEALIKTGNNPLALEYINKVKRRAYNLPINTPSAIDYASLTAATSASVTPTDHLANDPLKYERWAELFAEGQWWFDVRRWRIGGQEAAYFGSVKAGALVWQDYKYALPIPETEMNNNSRIQKQNDGY